MYQKRAQKTAVRRILALSVCLSMLLSFGSTFAFAQQPAGDDLAIIKDDQSSGPGQEPGSGEKGSGDTLKKEPAGEGSGPQDPVPDSSGQNEPQPQNGPPENGDPENHDPAGQSKGPADPETDQVVTSSSGTKTVLSSAPVKACPNHPAHDEACGYVPGSPEVPCDKGCTDTDGDGQIDHAPDCAYQPARPGSPCTHKCEICQPTPVTVTAQLPETAEVDQALDLMAGTVFQPAADTDGNAVSLQLTLQDPQGQPILLEGSLWTPAEPGQYQVTFTAVKTIQGQQISCGTLTHTLTVAQPESTLPTVLQQLFESRGDGDSLALALTGLLPEGRTFPQDQITALIRAETQEAFELQFRQALASLLPTNKTLTDGQFGDLAAETDPDRFRQTLTELLALPDDIPESITADGAPDVTLSWEDPLPQGITLAAKALETQDLHTLLSLDLQLTGEDGEPIPEPLDPPVSVTIHSERITGPGQHLYYVGPAQVQLFSELPVEAQIREGSLTFPLENPGVYTLKADYVITPDLPGKIFVDTQIEPLKNIKVSPEQYEGQSIQVRVKSIRLLGNDKVSWLPQQYFTPKLPGTWVILYEAYVGDTVLAQHSYHLEVESNRPVGELLDGDYAYIESAGMVQEETPSGFRPMLRSGSAPWDASEGPGNDTTAMDDIVRSFDIVTYTVFFQSKIRNDSPCSVYEKGRLFFEFILPGKSEEVRFEIESMGWLSSKNASYTIEELTFQGKPAQVLRGSYIWIPSEDNLSAIGESYQELNIALRTLNMAEGATIQPHYSFWLQYNDVGCSYNEDGTIPTGAPITGTSHICPTHGDAELRSFTGPQVTVTSQLRLNVRLVNGSNSYNQAMGDFDFNTGDPSAPHYGMGIQKGRLMGFGIELQLVGKGGSYGLRGCHLPDGTPITLDVNIDSVFNTDDGESYPAEGFAPLLWDAQANLGTTTTAHGRSLSTVSAVAYNVPGNDRTRFDSYQGCYDGGDWNFQISPQRDKISFTVSDYKFKLTDPMPFPYAYLGCNKDSYVYYNPVPPKNLGQIPIASFSAGSIWLFQPFYNEEQEYIAQKYGPGTFQITLEDTNLMAAAVDVHGNTTKLPASDSNSNQTTLDDDRAVFTSHLSNPGYISQAIIYTPYGSSLWENSLTKGCWYDGKDWILGGTPMSIYTLLSVTNAEDQYSVAAYEHLTKFDERFFEIEGAIGNYAQGNRRVLYGAKPDGTGWNHHGLEPSEPGYDAEMMRCTADDLIFYSSLEALRADNKTCVAALYEGRMPDDSPAFQPIMVLLGKSTSNDQLIGDVFMTTSCYRVWRKQDVEAETRKYLNKPDGFLTDEDYLKYVTEKLPSRADVTAAPLQYEDYGSQASEIYEYDNSPALRNYTKSYYDASGYRGGTAGDHLGDSCLLVGYTTSVEKKVAQLNDKDAEKKAFDLDVNQRIADYVINAQVNRGKVDSETTTETKDTIHLRDTLPKGLTYIPLGRVSRR